MRGEGRGGTRGCACAGRPLTVGPVLAYLAVTHSAYTVVCLRVCSRLCVLGRYLQNNRLAGTVPWSQSAQKLSGVSFATGVFDGMSNLQKL